MVFQTQGGIESLLPGPEDTSLAEYMLHRALIWSHDTDPAKFVRTKTNILQVMSSIVSYDDDGGEGTSAWQRAFSRLNEVTCQGLNMAMNGLRAPERTIRMTTRNPERLSWKGRLEGRQHRSRQLGL